MAKNHFSQETQEQLIALRRKVPLRAVKCISLMFITAKGHCTLVERVLYAKLLKQLPGARDVMGFSMQYYSF